MSLATAFADRARQSPDAVALFDRTATVTYGELAARAHAIGRGLARRGVVAGDRVGLALPRSIEQIAAMLALFELGAAMVPIDPAWPAARRAAIERDGELALVLSVEDLARLDRTAGDRVIGDNPIALALYTSGSTGDPKAVLIGHAALEWRCHALALAVPYAPGDIACHRTPPTFVDAYAEVFGPLLAGVPIFIVADPFAIADLVSALHTARITRLLLVPSVLALLLDAEPDLRHVRVIATSGEALPEPLARRCLAAAPHAKLVNIYGSTEVAGDATFAEITGEVTIGRPLAGVTARIVDEHGVEVARGCAGELVIAGPVVAHGYWNRPELTAQRFVDGAFRTGDLARALPDGRLVLAGRLDDQVKLGGVRIELGEIDRALRACPGVRAAAAACDGRRLVAGIVGDTDLGDVRERLGRELPAIAVPSIVVRLDALPTTSHGKLDRRALVAMATTTGSAIAPTGEDLPSRIAAWFTEVTGVPAGITDVFEAVGGDSLARLGLLVRLERAGLHIDRAALPSPLTPLALAQCVTPATPATDVADEASVTDFQRVMVLESLANAGTPMWSDQLAYTIRGALDRDRFADAWYEVIAAVPALRTTFAWAGDRVRRVVADDIPFALDHVDLRALDSEAYRLRVLAEEWTRISLAFPLAAPPLFAVALLQGPGDRSDLVFTYHHAILDGESARRVLRAVLARYAGRAIGSPRATRASSPRIDPRWRAMFAGFAATPERAAPVATSMGDTVWRAFHRILAIRGWFAARRVRRRAKPIRGLLAAAKLAPAVYAGGDITSQPLSVTLDRALRAWCAAHHTTPTAVWVTAFALHLARERNTRDVAFGVIVSGRDAQSAGAIGMLANCLPLRVELDRAASTAELVTQVAHRLDVLDQLSDTPMLDLAADLGIDARTVLDTQFVSWGFAADPAWTLPEGLAVGGGRGITMTAPTTALIVSGGTEVAVGARAFHRTDRIRREVLEIVDAIVTDAVLPRDPHEGGLSIAVSAL